MATSVDSSLTPRPDARRWELHRNRIRSGDKEWHGVYNAESIRVCVGCSNPIRMAVDCSIRSMILSWQENGASDDTASNRVEALVVGAGYRVDWLSPDNLDLIKPDETWIFRRATRKIWARPQEDDAARLRVVTEMLIAIDLKDVIKFEREEIDESKHIDAFIKANFPERIMPEPVACPFTGKLYRSREPMRRWMDSHYVHPVAGRIQPEAFEAANAVN